ncbi:MAG TPA: sugar phosphate isomerase/epimerase [Firmicutes bacterium]|nr:sugar phosphate isomerase/epimerase [Bacillota bacterium]
MKIGFMSSTCPNFTVDEVIQLAQKLGFAGFEPRVDWQHKHKIETSTDPKTVRELGRKITEAGIEIPCVATSVITAVKGSEQKAQLDLVKRMIDLAQLVGAPNIRVFCGGARELEETERLKLCIDTLAAAADIAKGSGVTLCLETHDYFRLGRLVGKAVDEVNRPEVQVLWDITHAVAAGEKVADTANFLKPSRVKHSHVRDLWLTPKADGSYDQKPCHDFGQGDAVPFLKEAAQILKDSGFNGVFSLEVIFKVDDTSHDPVAFLTKVAKGMKSVFNV